MPVLEGAPWWRRVRLKRDAARLSGLPRRRYEASLSLGCHWFQKSPSNPQSNVAQAPMHYTLTLSSWQIKKTAPTTWHSRASECIPGSRETYCRVAIDFPLPPLPPPAPSSRSMQPQSISRAGASSMWHALQHGLLFLSLAHANTPLGGESRRASVPKDAGRFLAFKLLC